ncbi:MAG: BsuBI/PstI family type II restriction endonuclease [Isosphaeraceae bacterium]
MSKIDEAVAVLAALGLPHNQQSERSGLTLLALATLGPDDLWANVQRPPLRIWDIMGFMREAHGKDYAANSRETIRRQTIHQFEQARIVDRNLDDADRPTNSGKTVYMLTEEAADVLKTYGTNAFDDAVKRFIEQFGSLNIAYDRLRETNRIPLLLPDGATVYLSPEHNALRVAIIEEFGPRFAPGAGVLHVGDTAKKHVIFDSGHLAGLGVPITEHDELPDVVLYDPHQQRLFMIEAVTLHGPVSPKRHREFESFLGSCLAERVYEVAFHSCAVFRISAADTARETEVWIAATQDHMIHFNGPTFLGPYKPQRTG